MCGSGGRRVLYEIASAAVGAGGGRDVSLEDPVEVALVDETERVRGVGDALASAKSAACFQNSSVLPPSER